jgi:uncharacterized membrane protein
MPFCPNCGSSVDGQFCAKCGTSMAGAAPAAGYNAPPVAATGLNENMAATLCYVLGLITGILFLVLAPYNQNRNIRFHAFQSIFLHLSVIAFYIVLGFMVHAFLGFMGFMMYPLIGLAVFALWLYILFSTYQGKKVVLPVIGQLAQQQA